MPKSDGEHGLLPAFTFNFFNSPTTNTDQQKNVNDIRKKQIIVFFSPLVAQICSRVRVTQL